MLKGIAFLHKKTTYYIFALANNYGQNNNDKAV